MKKKTRMERLRRHKSLFAGLFALLFVAALFAAIAIAALAAVAT